MLATLERQSAALGQDGPWLLLAELNHRMANELQAALCALRLAKRNICAGGEPTRFIEDALQRLESFGDVHQLLDRQRVQPPLPQRLEALCRAMSLAKAAPLGVHISIKLEDVRLDDEAAWTVCVVASELITNALKHAFRGGLPGVVGVVVRQDGDGVLLAVADTGMGLDCRSAETIWKAPGFGAGIVAELAERVGGYVTRVGGAGGTTVTFRIPAGTATQ